MPWGKANVGYLRKGCEIPDKLAHDQKTTELAEVKIRTSRCCYAAVQKGHMIEQVINKWNQRVHKEIHKTVNTVEKSGWFVDLSKRLITSVQSPQLLLQVSSWKIVWNSAVSSLNGWISDYLEDFSGRFTLAEVNCQLAGKWFLLWRPPYLKPCCVPFSKLHHFNFAHF